MAIRLHNGHRRISSMNQPTSETPGEGRFALVLDRDRLHVYGEPAFHYFLDVERARSVRSERLGVLLRVELKDTHGQPMPLSHETSKRLFIALAQSVRETDFLGWYEDQRVAGAVLTEVAGERRTDTIHGTVERVRRRFDIEFPASVSSRLEIRVTTIRDERTAS